MVRTSIQLEVPTEVADLHFILRYYRSSTDWVNMPHAVAHYEFNDVKRRRALAKKVLDG